MILTTREGQDISRVVDVLHAWSDQKGKLISINCAELNQVFERVTEATSIDARYRELRLMEERFEEARDGTLFIDQVHEAVHPVLGRLDVLVETVGEPVSLSKDKDTTAKAMNILVITSMPAEVYDARIKTDQYVRFYERIGAYVLVCM